MIRFCAAQSRSSSVWSLGWLGLVAIVGLFPTTGWTQVPFERLLPNDLFMLVKVQDLDLLHAKGATTRAGRLYRDPQFQAYFAAIQQEVGRTVNRLQAETNVDILEVLSLPVGQLAFALEPMVVPAEDRPKPIFYFMVELRGQQDKAQQLLRTFSNWLETQQWSRRSAGPNGQMVVHSRPDSRSWEHICYSLNQNFFILANNPERLESVLLAYEQGGTSEPLMQEPRYAEFRQLFGPASDVELYITLPQVLREDGLRRSNTIENVIARDLRYLGAGFSINKGDFETVLEGILQTEPQSQAFQFIPMPPQSLIPETWVTTQAFSYFTTSFDFGQFYTALSNYLNREYPGRIEQIETALQSWPNQQNPILSNIERDFIGLLGNRITLYSDLGTTETELLNNSFFSIKLNNTAAMQTLVNRVMGTLEPQLKSFGLQTRTVKGQTVYVLPNPTTKAEFALTVFNNTLSITSDYSNLERALNAGEQLPLAESANFQRIAAFLPPQVSGLYFYDPKAGLEEIYRLYQEEDLLDEILTQFADENEKRILSYVEGILRAALNKETMPTQAASQPYYDLPLGGYWLMENNNTLRGSLFQPRG